MFAVVYDGRQILKITKLTVGDKKNFAGYPNKMINHMLKGFFSLATSSCYIDGSTDGRYQLKSIRKSQT